MRGLRLFPVVLVAACGGVGSYEEAADATVRAMQDYAAILEGITDKAAAEKAKPKIEALAKRLDEILDEVNGLKEPSQESLEKSGATLREGMNAIAAKMDENMQRLDRLPDIWPTLQDQAIGLSSKFMALRAMLGA